MQKTCNTNAKNAVTELVMMKLTKCAQKRTFDWKKNCLNKMAQWQTCSMLWAVHATSSQITASGWAQVATVHIKAFQKQTNCMHIWWQCCDCKFSMQMQQNDRFGSCWHLSLCFKNVCGQGSLWLCSKFTCWWLFCCHFESSPLQHSFLPTINCWHWGHHCCCCHCVLNTPLFTAFQKLITQCACWLQPFWAENHVVSFSASFVGLMERRQSSWKIKWIWALWRKQTCLGMVKKALAVLPGVAKGHFRLFHLQTKHTTVDWLFLPAVMLHTQALLQAQSSTGALDKMQLHSAKCVVSAHKVTTCWMGLSNWCAKRGKFQTFTWTKWCMHEKDFSSVGSLKWLATLVANIACLVLRLGLMECSSDQLTRFFPLQTLVFCDSAFERRWICLQFSRLVRAEISPPKDLKNQNETAPISTWLFQNPPFVLLLCEVHI